MKFKEYIHKDIATFTNSEEFANSVIINEVEVNAVEDSEELQERIQQNYQGLVIGDVLFYISVEELKKVPNIKYNQDGTLIPNQAILYNGKPCVTMQCILSNGLHEIMLQYNN